LYPDISYINIESCIDMDISIEEGTSFIYEDDIEKALLCLNKALSSLQV